MKKLRDDKIKEESLLNNDKGLSFKRLSSFYSRGNKNSLLADLIYLNNECIEDLKLIKKEISKQLMDMKIKQDYLYLLY